MAKVNLSIDAALWRAFRVACLQRGTSASQAVSAWMESQVARWEGKMGPGAGSDYPPPLRDGLLNDTPDMVSDVEDRLHDWRRD